MINLQEKDIEEFIDLYKAEYGKTLSYPEAEIMATELLNLYNCLIPKK